MAASTSIVEQSLRAASASTSQRKPTQGQRLVLALASFVLLVPLTAITAALVMPLTESLPGWYGALITTCAQALVCAAVVGANLAINA